MFSEFSGNGFLPFANAKWICAEDHIESPILIRRFFCETVQNPVFYLTGLGWFEAKLNGVRIGQDRLVPVATDYEKRSFDVITYPCHDTFTHRIYFYRYDISELLQPGENVLSIQLGNGWYRQRERIAEGEMAYGSTLKALYALYPDTASAASVIVSDGSESCIESNIRYSNLFIGEIIDAGYRLERESPVRLAAAPDSALCPAIGTPDREIRILKPSFLHKIGNKTVYDCGENLSGVVRVYASDEKGATITLRFSEELSSDGSLDFLSTGANYLCKSGKKQVMTDTFICSGEPYVFEPKFVWHAFRYFDIEGAFDRLEVVEIHSDTPVTASFRSDSEGLNYLFKAFIRTQLTSMHGSFPSDCPHRERLGYTGDGQACAEAALLMLDSREFYRKWIRDILDCQDKTTGHVQHTAPFMGGGGGPGGWGCAIVLVPYAYYRRFGDADLLSVCFEPMLRWISYLNLHSTNGLVTSEEQGGWCLGDWCTLEPIRLPEPFVNTVFYVRCLRIIMKIAKLLGREADTDSYPQYLQNALEALQKTYYHAETGSYCDGTQGADAYAASIGLNTETTLRNTVAYYTALGHFDTGFLGTDTLLEVLFENGYAELAYRLLQSEELGSFLYMKRHGATTLWERWNGDGSHCHPMFGGCARHMMTHILGIGQPENECGFRTLRIKPCLPDSLSYAAGTISVDSGEISVAWRRENGRVIVELTLPKGVYGTLSLMGQECSLHEGYQSHTFS